MLDTTKPYWSRGRFWLLLALFSAVPFVVAPLPMMPDYFAHMARYHVMNHGADSTFLQRYYAFEWRLMGNLGVDLLMLPLGRVLPTELAARLATGLIPALSVMGIYALARALRGRIEASALLALSFIYTMTFVVGFANYHLSIALALLAMAAWLRIRDRGPVLRWLVMAPLGLLVWLAHVAGWGVLCLFVGGWELGQNRARFRRPWPSLRDTLLHALPLAVPIIPILYWRSQATAGLHLVYSMDSAVRKLALWPAFLMQAGVLWFDLALVSAVAILLVRLAGRGWHLHDRRLVLPLLLMLLAYLLLPFTLFGSNFADARILPVLAILSCVALVPAPQQSGRIAAVALVLFAARVAELSIDWTIRGAEAQADLAALSRVPIGSRIVRLAGESFCRAPYFRGFETLPNLAIVRRQAFVNAQWDIAGSHLMRPVYNAGVGYNDIETGLVSPPGSPCKGKPLAVLLREIPRDRFDFVWVFDVDVSADWLQPVFAGPHGRLYRIVGRSGGD